MICYYVSHLIESSDPIRVIKSLVKLNVPENKKEFGTLQKPITYHKLVKAATDEKQNMLVRCLLTYYLVTLAAALLKNSGNR